MYNNPYAKIKENAVNTATPEELTLMLYNGAVKFANQAIIAIEKKDYYSANKAIQKTIKPNAKICITFKLLARNIAAKSPIIMPAPRSVLK